MRGEDREVFGVVEVEPPVRNWSGNIHEEDISDEYVDNSKERANERAEEERGDGRPVQGEGTEAQTSHARSELLSCDRLGEYPTDP